ncbi:hypothetical protein C7S14_7262 [Burkholderia cepacia]|nr:hypothetical protein C7S14_7262 [Burkholderia cepacia]
MNAFSSAVGTSGSSPCTLITASVPGQPNTRATSAARSVPDA